MFKSNDIVGKPVIAQDTGKQIHKVHTLVVDPSRNQLVALVVEHGGLLGHTVVVPWEAVSKIGPDAVIIQAADKAVPVEHAPAIQAIMKKGHVFTGKKIMTTDGRELGTIADVFFDERTGIVVGYESTGGSVTDVTNGRPFISAPQTVKNGEDVLFVQPAAADLVDKPQGGLKAAVQSLSDKIQDAAPGPDVQQARDKQILQPVTDSNGLVFAAPGMIVTDATIQRAQAEHKEQELLQAAGVAAAPSGSSDGQSGAAPQKDVQQSVDQLNEGVGKFLDKIKGAVSDTQNQAKQDAEKAGIDHALGRPVTRVILDKQDHVILNVGELVTHEAIEKARQADVLDVLLSSIYDKIPELSKEDLSAPQKGEAALGEANPPAPASNP